MRRMTWRASSAWPYTSVFLQPGGNGQLHALPAGAVRGRVRQHQLLGVQRGRAWQMLLATSSNAM